MEKQKATKPQQIRQRADEEKRYKLNDFSLAMIFGWEPEMEPETMREM